MTIVAVCQRSGARRDHIIEYAYNNIVFSPRTIKMAATTADIVGDQIIYLYIYIYIDIYMDIYIDIFI